MSNENERKWHAERSPEGSSDPGRSAGSEEHWLDLAFSYLNDTPALNDDLQVSLSQEGEELSDALSLMAEEIASRMPPPRRSLKDRVMTAALLSSLSPAATDSARLPKPHVLREDEGPWIPEPHSEGIHFKILHQDPQSKLFNVLVRLAPGAEYPHHRHVGTEQCFVISGDLHVNDMTLHGGDFIVTPDGAEHVRTYTEGGCELLLTTLLADEML